MGLGFMKIPPDADLRSYDLRSSELRPTGHQPSGLRSTGLRPTDVRSNNIRSYGLRPSERRSIGLRPLELRPLRILFVVNGFAVGGGELKLLELVSELKKRYGGRYRAVVAAVGQSGPLHDPFAAAADRISVFSKKHPYDVSQVAGLLRLIREERIDVVQTTLFYADVIGTLAARLAGVTRIISWEAVTQPYGFKRMTAYRLAAKGFRMSVSVSDAIRLQVRDGRRVPGSRTRTIPYGVDTRKFRPLPGGASLRRTLGIPRRGLVFGTIARLTEQKGHRYLLEALPEIVRKCPDAFFVFAGDGPLRKSLEAGVSALRIGNHVRFLGFRGDIPELLASFDAFVLPSLYEGLPNAALEAMACGKPVIATAVDGTPEAVLHGTTGWLVPPRDPRALAGAVLKFCSDRRLMRTLGRNGRERAVKWFGIDGQITAFDELYRQVLTA
jgi:glycosyltransferase involved in cell wall biosynthesis